MATQAPKTLLFQTEGAVSQYQSMSENTDSLNRAEATALESHIDDLITRTSQALNTAGSQTTTSATEQAMLRKFRERLSTASEQYRRTKLRVQTELDRAELLRDAPRQDEGGDVSVAMDDLMRERGHISSASSMADSLVEQAMTTHDALEAQRTRMGASRGKLGTFDSLLDGTKKVMDKIAWKKRKNMIILGTVIAACLFFLFWWWIIFLFFEFFNFSL